ncbi:MAG: ATP-dependent DNA helicase RecG, partial [Rectinema sp.]
MFLRELLQPVSALRGAGPAIVPRLARLGIATVADLLSHFPRDYEDRSRFVPFSRFAAEPRVFTIAHVTGHEWFGFGRNRTLKIRVADESSEAILICFNRPCLEKSLPVGGRVLVGGKFQFRYGEIQSSAFDAEKLEEGKDPDRG